MISTVEDDFEDGNEAYVRGDYLAAISFYKNAAKQGFAEAQFNLGSMYALGKGVTQDYKQAEYWYEKAVEQGKTGSSSEPTKGKPSNPLRRNWLLKLIIYMMIIFFVPMIT